MNFRHLLAKLLPPVAYSPEQPRINAELTAEGQLFSTTYDYAGKALDGITPLFSADLLTDWERVLAITPGGDDSWQQRLEMVLIKLAEVGGLSRAYFIRLAKSAGYTITIEELDMFRAGESAAGEYINEDGFMWVWQVNIMGRYTPSYYFRAGESCAGDSLQNFGDPVIESWFNELKPAHTFCIFTYRPIPQGRTFDGSWQFDGTGNYTIWYL
ncbi:TPA: DUF2313 domain-containing protein [Klebsiella pneumoniae]|nr:DUF2313 domain-containing protein [Klebsiella pneumoniae]